MTYIKLAGCLVVAAIMVTAVLGLYVYWKNELYREAYIIGYTQAKIDGAKDANERSFYCGVLRDAINNGYEWGKFNRTTQEQD